MEPGDIQLANALRSLREFQRGWTPGPAANEAELSLQSARMRICSQVRCLHLALGTIRARLEPATFGGESDPSAECRANCCSQWSSGPAAVNGKMASEFANAGVSSAAASRWIPAAADQPGGAEEPSPRIRASRTCRSATAAMSTATGTNGAGDGAESARRSLTLSLALAEQFAHADSSSEDEEEAAEHPAPLPVSNGLCAPSCSLTATAAAASATNAGQLQHQQHLQHQQQQHLQHQQQQHLQHQQQQHLQHQQQQHLQHQQQQHLQHQQMHQCHSWDSSTQQEQQQQQQRQLARRIAPHERLIIENQRRKVCEEIVETERKYCSCLWTLIDLIGGSLRAAAFVNTRDLCLIFPNTLPRLYDIHAEFLASLEESDDCARPQQPHCSLAEAVQGFLLSRERRLLQLYRSYVAQFGAAMRCVRRLRRRSRKFRDLLQSLQRHPDCEGLELTAFLLTPVQRLPRYLLLLRQLADRTDPRHPDLGHLASATDRLRGLLDQLNCSIQGALAEATAWTVSGESSAAAAAGPDEEAATSGEQRRQQQQRHFLLAAGQSSRQRRRSAQPESLTAHHPWDSPRHLKRSQRRGAGQQAEQPGLSQQQQQQRCRSVPPEEAGGCRNRVVVFQISPETARRLRPGDRSRSAGDVISGGGGGASVRQLPAPAEAAGEAASSAAAAAGGGGRRRKSSPRTAVKETLRKMFLSRRKVSDSRIDSSWSDL